MLADGNGEFAEAVGLTMDGVQVRHGQAQPALFDDRQRRRRRAGQCRGAGRIFGLQRGDDARPALTFVASSTSSRLPAATARGLRALMPSGGRVKECMTCRTRNATAKAALPAAASSTPSRDRPYATRGGRRRRRRGGRLPLVANATRSATLPQAGWTSSSELKSQRMGSGRFAGRNCRGSADAQGNRQEIAEARAARSPSRTSRPEWPPANSPRCRGVTGSEPIAAARRPILRLPALRLALVLLVEPGLQRREIFDHRLAGHLRGCR